MALAGVGQKYLWTKGDVEPPAPGEGVARFNYRFYPVILLILLGL